MPPQWQIVFYGLLQWLYPLQFIIGLSVSLRHLRLSRYMPVLAGGFGATLTANLVSLLYRNMVSHLPLTVWANIVKWPFILPLAATLNLVGGALIATGLTLVFHDMRQKLALLEIDVQNGLRYTHTQQQNREENHASAFVPASGPLFVAQPVPPAANYVAPVVPADRSDTTITLGSSHS